MRREGNVNYNNSTGATQTTPQSARTSGSAPTLQKDLPWVLVVEDNRLNSELVKIYLKAFCNMDFARTGEAAVEMAAQKQYAAIVMDINLGPGMDGIQATRAIRMFHGYTETPIIAVTGYTMESDKEQILASGCSHYVPKPIDKCGFTSLMQSLLEKK